MKAIEFDGHNVKIAEKQEEYETLPAFAQDGLITFCMELSKEELKAVRQKKKVRLQFFSFGKPPQPVGVSVKRPMFPVNPYLKTESNPTLDKKDMSLTYSIPVNYDELKQFGRIWVTLVTHNSPMQPMYMDLV